MLCSSPIRQTLALGSTRLAGYPPYTLHPLVGLVTGKMPGREKERNGQFSQRISVTPALKDLGSH